MTMNILKGSNLEQSEKSVVDISTTQIKAVDITTLKIQNYHIFQA